MKQKGLVYVSYKELHSNTKTIILQNARPAVSATYRPGHGEAVTDYNGS
jgi:hypothetical protein